MRMLWVKIFFLPMKCSVQIFYNSIYIKIVFENLVSKLSKQETIEANSKLSHFYEKNLNT